MNREQPEPRGTPSIRAGAPSAPPRDLGVTDQQQSEIDQVHEPSALDRENPADGPMQERRKLGVAQPDWPDANDKYSDTPDQQGIEIDNAIERPQEGGEGRRSN